jgi:CoA:oxalate CoA-transferase
MSESNKLENGGFNKNLPSGCLDGVKILDFTCGLSGTHATKLMADMGATVIKVETYPHGAIERNFPMTATHEGVTQSSYSINVNRGKKSLCINREKLKGGALIHELIKKCDIVCENFAPGVMDRLQLDYESVKKIKKDIIYCSISPFGHWGPYTHRPGLDIIVQGISGWTASSENYQIAPVAIGSSLAGIHAAIAMVSAVRAKQRFGIGQNIDISMMDCLFSLHENSLPWYTMGQAIGKLIQASKVGILHPGYAPYGIFKGKDGYICIANLTEARWEPMIKVMGDKYTWLLTEPRSKTLAARCQNAAFVHEQVSEWVNSIDSVKETARLLEEAGVPCTKALTIEELADDNPQVIAREMLPVVEQPFIGSMKMIGCPMKFSETQMRIRGHAPLLGEHNKEVLTTILGHTDEQVKELYNENVLHHEESVDRL